ncbi:MAG: hypothetical protein AAGG56_07195 [Pseudomonadota bacterium]
MSLRPDPTDPKGLIADAFSMDLTVEDCRTIFLDWAVGHAGKTDRADIATLLDLYRPKHPDHPMIAVLEEGLVELTHPPSRRGGAQGRRR